MENISQITKVSICNFTDWFVIVANVRKVWVFYKINTAIIKVCKTEKLLGIKRGNRFRRNSRNIVRWWNQLFLLLFFFIAERAARCISFKNMLLEKNVELFVLTREIWTVAYLKNKRKDNEKEPREMKLWNLTGSRKIYIAVFNELLNFYKYGIQNWRRQNNSELVLLFADINTIFSL